MLIKKTKIPFRTVATIGILPSFLKKAIYRLKGYKIGKNVTIGLGSVIIGNNVKIESNVRIGLLTIIRGDEIKIERFATIGSFTVIDSGKVRIGEDARINEQVIIGGMKTPQSSFDLGKRTIIMEYSFINTTMPVQIGDDSGIGGHCLLFTHGSWLSQLEGFPVTFKPITIGKSVWLPWRVFIMPGVTIGDKVVVGANSLISKSVEPNCLVAGSPAKVIKENYPTPIQDDQKVLIFSTFIEEFIDYLKFNGIKTTKSENEFGLTVNDDNNKIHFSLFLFLNNFDENIQQFKGDTLVIFNIINEQNRLPMTFSDNIMYLDVYNKNRLGTSEVGEEFVKFISRYGLRFSRLD
jgi:acetyltransferase-like isoleucine patch superfamily enzyme